VYIAATLRAIASIIIICFNVQLLHPSSSSLQRTFKKQRPLSTIYHHRPESSKEPRTLLRQLWNTSFAHIMGEMPDSPPLDDGEILKHGLHHLVQHNSKTSYPQEQYNEGVHLQSQSTYGSPAPMQDDTYAYPGQQPEFVYQHQHQDSSLGISYVRRKACTP
jgi:hypothetical protein